MSKTTNPRTLVQPTASLRTVLIGVGATVLLLLGLVLTGLIHNVWVQVIILGVVQGLTEFLPISSTGHLLIVSNLLQFPFSLGGTFEIFIQLGTVFSVLIYYFRDLLQQAQGFTSNAEVRRFWLAVLLAFIPAVIVGLLFGDWIKAVIYDTPAVIAAALIVGGIVFIGLERMPPRPVTTAKETDISFRQALTVGLAQVTAFVPGVSRSGASIVGGLLAGLDRRAATAFSFYLSIPTLGAATVVDLLRNLDQVTADDAARLLLGAVVAGIVGWLSIGWLLRFVATNSFVPFGIYRILAGVLILLMVAAGVL